ncbi:TIR domain-containing protein, partial [Pedobacter jejuensis]
LPEYPKAIRDNVLFELGLFIGSLSIDSVYFIKPHGDDLHLPTDLIGLTPGEYDSQHPNIDAAVGPFCTKVEKLIKQRYEYAFIPQTRYGLNLLSETTKNIEAGKNYCIAIKIPKGSNFLLNIKQPNYFTNNNDRQNLIAYSFGDVLGFRFLERDSNGIILSIDLDTEIGEYGVKVFPGSFIIFEGYLNGNKILDKQFGESLI